MRLTLLVDMAVEFTLSDLLLNRDSFDGRVDIGISIQYFSLRRAQCSGQNIWGQPI
jgi:hypothetical protein